RRALALARIAAIGGERRAHPLRQHPAEHLAGVRRELNLQQLLPHLLLPAAQIGDVIGEAPGSRQEPAAEMEEGIEGLPNLATAPEIVAEVDQASTRLKPPREVRLQARKPLRLAMDGGDRPDAPGGVEHGELVPILAHAPVSCSRKGAAPLPCDARD